jgi:hypothetical protein
MPRNPSNHVGKPPRVAAKIDDESIELPESVDRQREGLGDGGHPDIEPDYAHTAPRRRCPCCRLKVGTHRRQVAHDDVFTRPGHPADGHVSRLPAWRQERERRWRGDRPGQGAHQAAPAEVAGCVVGADPGHE